MTNDKADFTQGSILKKLVAFMMPVLGALILQAAYGAVDLLVVGRFGSTSGLSAVSTGSQVLNLVTFVVIQFAMGIQDDGTLNGISILSIGETAGLGMRANTDAFKDQFKDKNVDKFEYTKTGATADDQIDALSGATITTNAMTNGVNAGLCAFQYEKGGNQ